MSIRYNVAVLGATGVVGASLIGLLEERDFPVDTLFPLASERSLGESVSFRGKQWEVQDVAQFDFSQTHIGLFSAGADVSAQFAPKAAEAGCVVIDNTSYFRYQTDIPLIVPEVNPECIGAYRNRNIIANPNCSTIQLVVALKPLYDAAGITRINVATYQSVSGAGKSGIHELAEQTAALLNGQPLVTHAFPKQIAFNVFPHIDRFEENGYTREEMKMVWETRKLFNDPTLQINPTAVRVPVFYGHSEAVHLETQRKLSACEAILRLQDAPGIILLEEDYPTPAVQGACQDAVYVGRVRDDISHPHGLNLWIVADNVRKGAALNAVQIAELLLGELD